MNFVELDNQRKIREVKHQYVNLIGEIHTNKSKLDEYLPLLPTPKDKTTPEELSLLEARKKEREMILSRISTIKLKVDCLCEPRELEIDVDQIPEEFEILIDFAQTRAEAKNY